MVANVWTAKHLRAACALAPAALGKAGITPHLIRRWRSLTPVAEAYEARCEAAEAMFQLRGLEDRLSAAREALEAAEKRVIELPAHTGEGIGAKARLWTEKRAGQWGTLWDLTLPAPLKAVMDAALAVERRMRQVRCDVDSPGIRSAAMSPEPSLRSRV